jgi:peptide deformylase
MIKAIVTNIVELRKPCLAVEKGENVAQILVDLHDTLLNKKGLALSANQIGYNKKISFIRMPTKYNKETKETEYKEFYLINAKIIEKENPIKVKDEQCLSFSGVSVITKRYIFVVITYLNEKFEEQTAMMQDLEALICQHECDHQNGIVLFDRKWKAK